MNLSGMGRKRSGGEYAASAEVRCPAILLWIFLYGCPFMATWPVPTCVAGVLGISECWEKPKTAAIARRIAAVQLVSRFMRQVHPSSVDFNRKEL